MELSILSANVFGHCSNRALLHCHLKLLVLPVRRGQTAVTKDLRFHSLFLNEELTRGLISRPQADRQIFVSHILSYTCNVCRIRAKNELCQAYSVSDHVIEVFLVRNRFFGSEDRMVSLIARFGD